MMCKKKTLEKKITRKANAAREIVSSCRGRTMMIGRPPGLTGLDPMAQGEPVHCQLPTHTSHSRPLAVEVLKICEVQ